MLAFKMVKPFSYFRRHPQDLALLPFYLSFTYFHSGIKLWALLTFWDTRWCGRGKTSRGDNWCFRLWWATVTFWDPLEGRVVSILALRSRAMRQKRVLLAVVVLSHLMLAT